MDGANLYRLARKFADHRGLSLATVSNYVCGHARLFVRLEAGHSCTLRTYARAVQWFSDHWPTDLDWPADIPRSDPSPDAPADQAAAQSVSQAPEYRSGADLVVVVRAARERSVDAMGDAERDPDWDAARQAKAEMMTAATTLGPDGRIASVEALCLALGVERHVFDNAVRLYADGGPREHKRPRKRRPFSSPTEKMFHALVESGDVRFASRRAELELLARAGFAA